MREGKAVDTGTGRDRTSQVRVLTHQQALEAARKMFIAEGRLDMQALARRLAVSRATLYRVVVSRDRLLGDVLWSLAAPALQAAVEEANEERGLERILRIGSRFRSGVLGFEPLRTFARAEPLTTGRALFTPEMNERLVQAWRAILLDAVENDEGSLPVDAVDFAEIIVRLGGSLLYADLLADQARDTDLAAVVTRALFAQRG